MRLALLIGTALNAYAQTATPGCVAFCGTGYPDCLAKCETAVAAKKTLLSDTPPMFELEPLATLETTSEITGSDMYIRKPSGKLFFTTRDGGVYRFIPRPKEGGRVVEEIYRFDASLQLDTAADKGLYDIAFPRQFKTTRLCYLAYAAACRETDAANCNHVLSVAEFSMDKNENITFRSIVEQLPQTVPYRSGGFLKSATDYATEMPAPLWLSSGGNQENDANLLAAEPKYSSIYGITPHSIKPVHSQGPSFALWANGLANPYECDYAALTKASEIVCLTRHYDQANQLLSVALFKAEAGHTFNEETSTFIQSNGYRTTEKMHSYTQIFDAENSCVPDSVIQSTFNLLGHGYQNRIIIAKPTCDIEDFKPSELQVLTRNSKEKRWELVPMHLDMGGRNLWNMQLMGAERSRGLFLAGRDLNTNTYTIYLVNRIE